MDDSESTEIAPGDEPVPAPPRRNRIGVALVVLGIVFTLGAIPVAVVGFSATSDATDAREAASAAQEAQRVQEARRLNLSRERIALEALVTGMPTRAQGFAPSVLEVGNAESHLQDVANRAARAYNGGDPAGSTTLWQTEGKTALDDLNAKDAATQRQLQEMHTLLRQLQAAT